MHFNELLLSINITFKRISLRFFLFNLGSGSHVRGQQINVAPCLPPPPLPPVLHTTDSYATLPIRLLMDTFIVSTFVWENKLQIFFFNHGPPTIYRTYSPNLSNGQ